MVLFSVLSYAHADYQVGKDLVGTNSVIYLENDEPFTVSYIGQLAESRSASLLYGVPEPSAGYGTLQNINGMSVFDAKQTPMGLISCRTRWRSLHVQEVL